MNITQLKTKINNLPNVQDTQIIDESALHTQHKSFQEHKAYLKIIITMSGPIHRISIHRQIKQIAFNLMPIHALSIKINNI
ncbi:hypothetical protein MMH89_01980 [Candidatus Comchoanobacter bicostacola]|uniref:BolA family transcriptional regulator n=1 Tax=Candidatus Comchoanobacter bicostacola TaxID=2919598 RepID=A0ABY5DM44_9GAMM|nr:hypothetical protein [Candidatus Comchoanobacter bicostacola]UTC24917.1 hypothetical protein MMH89_01980 [Candidatus Comchoanobacter bicostacola]